jgi:hypothetical protein
MVKRDGADVGGSLSNMGVGFLVNNATCSMQRGKSGNSMFHQSTMMRIVQPLATLSQFEAQQTLTKINQ